MKTPPFWYHPSPAARLIARILTPASYVYAALVRAHRGGVLSRSVEKPVICLGNLVAGGSGKTPAAIALMALLKDSGLFFSPAFVTRGYGGSITGPERVDECPDPHVWGDEALLLARHAPTFVARSRYDGAVMALAGGADCIILDDGLQHGALDKTISLCVIDGQMGFGNGQVIPAGPLREPLADGFDRCDAFILVGEDARGILPLLPADKPVFRAHIAPRVTAPLPPTPYFGFCGIGYPDKFRTTLENMGVTLAGWRSFADHHAYDMADMTALVRDALRVHARLITTEKDFVRLPDFAKKSLIDVLPIAMVFDDPQALMDFVRLKTGVLS